MSPSAKYIFAASIGAWLSGCAAIPDADEPAPQGQPVVVGLLQTAEQDIVGGRLDQAAHSLERALRIEPQNALLWHRLAGVRLQQGRAQDAVSLASRSTTLTTDERLITANWELIAEAHEFTGDAAKAAEAKRKANISE